MLACPKAGSRAGRPQSSPPQHETLPCLASAPGRLQVKPKRATEETERQEDKASGRRREFDKFFPWPLFALSPRLPVWRSLGLFDLRLSCSPQPAFADAEEADQGVEMAAVGRDLDQIRSRRTGQLSQGLAAPARRTGVGVADLPAVRVQQDALVRFGVFELHEAQGRQFIRARVGDVNGNEVVPAGRALERVLEVLVEKIAEQEHDRAAAQDAVDEIESIAERRAALLGLEEQDVANEPEHVAGALPRRHKTLDAV